MENFDELNESGITVIKKRKNKKKIILLIAIFIILVSVLIYVSHVYSQMVLLSKENISNEDSNNVNEEKEISIIENENIVENKLVLPKLTEKGINNIQNIYKSTEKIAYLTFDDGPSTQITPLILETLENYNIKATFFLLGQNVARYPELVKEEYREGHYLANHSYTHVYDKIYSSVQAVLDEYNRTEQAIKNALDNQEYETHLFRFPGGSGGTKYKNVKSEAKIALANNNIAYIDWNALTNDSVGNPTEESIMQNLKDTVGNKNSVVILMHDSSTKKLTAKTLPNVIEYLQGQGYSFKTFYDVIE